MGIAHQRDYFPCKQVNPCQQRNCPKAFILMITVNLPIFFRWAQVVRCICNSLNTRFFIIRNCYCKLIVIRHYDVPVFIKLKLHLLVNQQDIPHFRFKGGSEQLQNYFTPHYSIKQKKVVSGFLFPISQNVLHRAMT